jgi:hypothetical protein
MLISYGEKDEVRSRRSGAAQEIYFILASHGTSYEKTYIVLHSRSRGHRKSANIMRIILDYIYMRWENSTVVQQQSDVQLSVDYEEAYS